MKRRFWVVGLLALLVLSSCQGRRFEPGWSISKFRLFGIKATPPELRPNESTTLEALTYAPGDGPVSYRWEWCPFQTFAPDQYACPITQEELEEMIEQGAPDDVPSQLFEFPDFDLGTDPTAELEYPFFQPVLVAFCQVLAEQIAQAEEENEELAGALPTFDCEETYEISVRVVVRNDEEPATDEMIENLTDQPQGELIVARKRVRLWLGSENEQDRNPGFRGMEIRPANEEDLELLRDFGHDWVDEIEDVEEDWYEIPADEPVPILVGIQYELRALVDPDSIQTWSKLAAVGSEERYLDPQSEVLEYDWFTTQGALSADDAFYVEGRTPLDEVAITGFHIPTRDTSQQFNGADGQRFIDSCPELEDDDPDDGCEITIWNVVRDDRRGVNWMTRRLIATGIVEGRLPQNELEALSE